MTGQPAVAVIGVGNALRHDDALGLECARRLAAEAEAAVAGIAVRAYEGEPLGLLDLWEGMDAVVLVDATPAAGAPGTIRRVDASRAPVPARMDGCASTHAVGLAKTIELARALHRLPGRVVLFGVEGRRFDAGRGLSPEVQAAVAGPLAEAVLGEARALRGG